MQHHWKERDIVLAKSLVKIFGSCFLFGCVIMGSGCGSILSEKALENGAAFEEKGQLTEAMAEYNRAIELDPRNTNAYYNRASLYQKQGKPEAAFADFNKIIEINPNYSQSYYGRGLIYDGQGQRDKAIAEYTKAIENNAYSGFAYLKRAVAYNSKGEYRKALDDARKAESLEIRVSKDLLKQIEEGASKQ